VYFEKNDTDNAITYYQQSLQLRQKVDDPVYLAVTLSSLGDVYAAMGDYDKALENLMKALDTSRKRMTPMGRKCVGIHWQDLYEPGASGSCRGRHAGFRERIPLRKEQECGLGRVFE